MSEGGRASRIVGFSPPVSVGSVMAVNLLPCRAGPTRRSLRRLPDRNPPATECQCLHAPRRGSPRRGTAVQIDSKVTPAARALPRLDPFSRSRSRSLPSRRLLTGGTLFPLRTGDDCYLECLAGSVVVGDDRSAIASDCDSMPPISQQSRRIDHCQDCFGACGVQAGSELQVLV